MEYYEFGGKALMSWMSCQNVRNLLKCEKVIEPECKLQWVLKYLITFCWEVAIDGLKQVLKTRKDKMYLIETWCSR